MSGGGHEYGGSIFTIVLQLSYSAVLGGCIGFLYVVFQFSVTHLWHYFYDELGSLLVSIFGWPYIFIHMAIGTCVGAYLVGWVGVWAPDSITDGGLAVKIAMATKKTVPAILDAVRMIFGVIYLE